jgi:competence protein ComEC
MIRKYPSLLLLLFVVIGIVISDQTHLPCWIFLFVSLACFVGGFFSLTHHSSRESTILFGLSLLFFSAFNFGIRFYDVGPRHISRVLQDGEVYHIFGEVTDWPRLKTNHTEMKIALDSITTDATRNVHGTILLKLTDTTTALQRGDRIEFYGRIYSVKGSNLPGKFNYQRYLNLKGVYGIVYLPTLLDVRIDKGNRFGIFNYVDKLRASIRGSFYQNLSPTAAALAAGFLIGETRDIPTTIYKRFRDTGTLHLLAVSGSNVALVVLSFMFLLQPFSLSRRKRAVVLLFVIFLFALLSYGEPSVMRASIMAALVIAAGVLERRYDLNNVIAATALIILLSDPTQLYDVGFQLSFVTAWGLIFITPQVAESLRRYHSRLWYRLLIFPLMISVIAQVCSMPLIVLYFHRLPVISVVANLIIVPLVSIAVIGIILLLVAHLILPLLGMFVGSLLNQLLNLVVCLLAELGGENIPLINVGEIPPLAVLLFYAYLILLVMSLRSKRIRRMALISLAVIINIGLLGGFVGSMQQSENSNIYALTVPGGVAGVVKQAGSNNGDLIITGLIGTDYEIDDRIIVPVLEGLEISRVNSLFVVSSDFDAIDDLVRLAERYRVETIYIASSLKKSFADVVHAICTEGETGRVVSFPRSLSASGKQGYYPSRLGVLANFGSTVVLFTDRMESQQLTLIPRKEQQSLIFCGRLDVKSIDLTKSSLWTDIEQPRSRLLGLFSPGNLTPASVYNLDKLGTVKVEISQKDSTPVKIELRR